MPELRVGVGLIPLLVVNTQYKMLVSIDSPLFVCKGFALFQCDLYSVSSHVSMCMVNILLIHCSVMNVLSKLHSLVCTSCENVKV